LLTTDYAKQWQLEITEELDDEIIKGALKSHTNVTVSDGSFNMAGEWLLG